MDCPFGEVVTYILNKQFFVLKLSIKEAKVVHELCE